MTHAVTVILAALGVAAEALVVLSVLLWRRVRRCSGATSSGSRSSSRRSATAGSLFFSEVAHFVPCELCWYQRICMYPLVAPDAAGGAGQRLPRRPLPASAPGDRRRLLRLPPAGRERRRATQARACQISAPGGCAIKWINEFGYVTIPTLALTGFALVFAFLPAGGLRAGGLPEPE